LRAGLDYPEVARRCRLITDITESVILTDYGSAEEQAAVADLIVCVKRKDPDMRTILRKLQPYVVSMPWYIVATYRP
jgi:hypothetical protein